MKKIIALILTSIAIVPAYADWQQIGSDSGFNIYYDNTSLKQNTPQVKSLKVAGVPTQEQAFDTKVQNVSFMCGFNWIVYTDATYYKNKQVIKSETYSDRQFSPIGGDGAVVDSALYKIACGK